MQTFVAVNSLSDLKKITADEVGLVRLLQEAELLQPAQQCSKWHRNMKLKVTKRANACKWIWKPTSSCTGWECTVRTDSKTNILKIYKILREIGVEYVETQYVEIDESVITKRKYHRARIAENNQVWLVGGICRETREIFLELVEKLSAENLHQIITNNVSPGTTILTNGWRAYIGLDELGYVHETINHSENFLSS
uniref:DDE_Tnp_IS1595 domain-containing protein n=1 Tax=Anopheles christyi TaxID=43041 RepID=A0A182KEY8_9DIPT